MRYLILLPILFLYNIVSATAQEKVSGVTPIFNTAKEAVAFFDPYGDIKEDIKEQDHKVEDFKNEIKKLQDDGTSLEKVLELKKEQKKLLEEEIETLKQSDSSPNLGMISELNKDLAKLNTEIKKYTATLNQTDTSLNLKSERLKLLQEQVELEKEKLRRQWERKANRTSLLRKILISVFAIFIAYLSRILLFKLIRNFQISITPKNVIRESERVLRIKTLSNLFRWLSTLTVFGFAVYVILSTFGVDTTVLLASAGIIGVAEGFGGQYLVRDIITGIFIIIEGQFRIDDVVEINGLAGLVEDINLRITTLRDLEGRVILIPNGEIKTVINLTKEFSFALFDLGVAYKEDVDRVIKVIYELGGEIRNDPNFRDLILDNLEMFGVDKFDDSAVIIKFRIKTLPIKQWEVGREFRRRIKNRFDELGIEIPFPHRTLYFGSGVDLNNLNKVSEMTK